MPPISYVFGCFWDHPSASLIFLSFSSARTQYLIRCSFTICFSTWWKTSFFVTHSHLPPTEFPWLFQFSSVSQSCPTLCDSMNPNTTGLPVYHQLPAAAKSLQSCPTLCNPIDGSPWGSPIPGILQARTLEWVAISFSNAWKWKVKVKSLSRVRFLATSWTAAYQAPLSMGFASKSTGVGCQTCLIWCIFLITRG